LPISDVNDKIDVIDEIKQNMATVKASEIGVERLRHAQESMRRSWEDVAAASFVAKATIYKLLNGDGVTRETVLALAKYFKLDRREIVTDREWYPQWIDRSTGDLWKMLQEEAREDVERFRAILAADKPQLVREGMSTLGAIPYRQGVPSCNSVVLNGEVVFCVDVPSEGHLVLLEREPKGSIVCLSPSEFVRQNRLSAGLSILPQLDNPNNLEALGSLSGFVVERLFRSPYLQLRDNKDRFYSLTYILYC
jgi:transcriptional regulator with XRE-family HTH domain